MAQQREYDWLDFSHGPVTGPLVGVAASVFLAEVTRAVSAPGMAPLVPAVLGAAAAIVVGHRHQTPKVTSGYWVASSLAIGAWASWVAEYGWSPLAFYVLVGLAIVAGILAPAFTHTAEGYAAGQDSGRLAALRTPLAVEWRDRIIRICKVAAETEIVRVDKWPGATGDTLHGEFPPESGHTWEDVAAQAFRLGGAAHLPKGCLVRVTEGDHQGAFVVEVPRRNGLAQEVDFPADLSPLTVTEPIQVAKRMDSRWATVHLRESAGLIVARRGAGKTNCLHVLTGQLCRCLDVVIWHVDLNGGGMSVPWVYPYANNEVDVPAVDWVASTPEEAVRMATVALAVAKDRKQSYGRLKYQHNSTLLPVSADLPEIVILVDEGAEIMGETSKAWKGKEMFEEVLRIGRAEAVNVVFSGLRATSTVISGMVLSQVQMRVGGQMKDDADLAYLFGWQKLRSTDLTERGTTFMQTGEGEPPEKVRWCHLKPQRIGEIAIATANLRPKLDERAQKIGGDVYRDRWGRTRPMLLALAAQLDGEPVDIEDEPAPPDPAQDIPPGPDTAREETARTTLNLRRAVAEVEARRLIDREFADFDKFFATTADEQPKEVPGASAVLVDEEPELTPRQAAILDLVDAAGPEGTGPKEIGEALTNRDMEVSRQTLNIDLNRLMGLGKVAKRNGKQGVYITPRHADGQESQ